MSGPLQGLRVVDLSNTLTSAHISGYLADFGADVVDVEPPGGSPLRSTAPARPSRSSKLASANVSIPPAQLRKNERRDWIFKNSGRFMIILA